MEYPVSLLISFYHIDNFISFHNLTIERIIDFSFGANKNGFKKFLCTYTYYVLYLYIFGQFWHTLTTADII